MAHDRRWYKRHPGDFLMGTVGLDLETIGAYSLILDVLNDRDRPLPDDDKFLAGILRVSVRKWKAIRDTLLAAGKLIVLEDGCLSNPRFERERAERLTEREKAVQAGREGGLKSAALRASQGDLGLENDAKTPRKPAENAVKTERKVRETNADPAENNDLAQDPPQPSRARQIPELRDNTPTTTEPTSPAHAHAREGPVDDDAPPEPLVDFVSRLGSMAGLNFTQPANLTRAIDQVKEWEAAGIARTTIEETIAFKVSNAPPGDGSYSLKRYDAPVRAQHGRNAAAAKTGTKPAKPPEPPRFTFDDEDPRFEPIRRAIAKAVDPRVYALWMNAVRLRAEGRTVRVNGSTFQAQWVVNHLGGTILPLIRQHGFERLD